MVGTHHGSLGGLLETILLLAKLESIVPNAELHREKYRELWHGVLQGPCGTMYLPRSTSEYPSRAPLKNA